MEKKIRAAKGEGSFAYNPDGTVTHRKSVGRKTNGKRKILTVTAQTKTASANCVGQRHCYDPHREMNIEV